MFLVCDAEAPKKNSLSTVYNTKNPDNISTNLASVNPVFNINDLLDVDVVTISDIVIVDKLAFSPVAPLFSKSKVILFLLGESIKSTNLLNCLNLLYCA